MNPHDAQIVFADLQPQIVARSITNAPRNLCASAGVLAKIAGLLDLPMTFSVVPEGGKPAELIPELRACAAADEIFPRQSADPFLDPATRARLKAANRSTLIVAGFANEVVTLHATLSALGAGYAVHVPVDASGGMSDRSEAAAFRQIENAGGVVTSVVSLATMMTPDFSGDPGASVFEALQALRLG